MEIIIFLVVAFVIYTVGYNHGRNEELRRSEFAKSRLISDGLDPSFYFED